MKNIFDQELEDIREKSKKVVKQMIDEFNSIGDKQSKRLTKNSKYCLGFNRSVAKTNQMSNNDCDSNVFNIVRNHKNKLKNRRNRQNNG